MRRREFIQASSLAGGAALLSGCALMTGKSRRRKMVVVQCWDDGVTTDTYARTVVPVAQCFPPADPMEFHPNCHHEVTDFWDCYEKARESGVFYFWGHSYEMINDQMWSLFEDKIKRISNDSGAEWGIVADLFASNAPH